MKKLIFILTILTLSLSCSGDGIGGESIILYDFTAYVEATIDDIRTNTGKIIHTRQTTKTLKVVNGVTPGELSVLRDQYPARVEVKNVVYDGNLTVRTTNRFYNNIAAR